MRTSSPGNCSQSQPAQCCVAGKQKAGGLFPVLWTWTSEKGIEAQAGLREGMSGIQVEAHLKNSRGLQRNSTCHVPVAVSESLGSYHHYQRCLLGPVSVAALKRNPPGLL